MSTQFMLFSLADIFSVYPSIFSELVVKRKKITHIYLPSDEEWQEKMYYLLLDVQKQINEAINSGMDFEVATQRTKKPVFDENRTFKKYSPVCSPNGIMQNKKICEKPRKILTTKTDEWSLELIYKAAKLLKKPKEKCIFIDEHEMRKVYSLIYDVFRFKVVLSIVLNDVNFYEKFPQYSDDYTLVWLMFYELLCRGFRKRNSVELDLQAKFDIDENVAELADALWKIRINLAASVSRVRVEYRALRLTDLLPIHLQTDKVALAAANPIVTGWVNPFLVQNKEIANQHLTDLGFEILCETEENSIKVNQCKWDNVCPLFLSCFPPNRSLFSKSKIVSENMFIMQDRTFAYGPAVLSTLLDHFDLEGDILQTHIDSPRATAYLAALFHSVTRVNNLYAYGAGTKLREYRKYMENLGVSNIRIFEEVFTSFPLESNRFRSVVGVFVNPANSFSAISDPIDLICSRGGDLQMLKVLTESDISDDGKREVLNILDDQLTSLQHAMSRSQTQFLLYQTHSIVDTENENMIKHALELTNQLSIMKQRNILGDQSECNQSEAPNILQKTSNLNTSKNKKKLKVDSARNDTESFEDILNNDSKKTTNENLSETFVLEHENEFVLEKIPDICVNQDNCLNLKREGCFLSLIRRRNITRLNAKYLIAMAEKRGLFGKVSATKEVKIKKKSIDFCEDIDGNLGNALKKRYRCLLNIDALINRLLQRTYASDARSNLKKCSSLELPITSNIKRRECIRYMDHHKAKVSKCPRSQSSWWKYILVLVKSGSNAIINKCLNKDNVMVKETLKKQPYPMKISEIKFFEHLN